MNLLTLIVLAIIPVTLWAYGWYFENKCTKYPDTSKGYRSESVKKNEESWVYANKVASKIFSITGSILFVVIAIGSLLFDVGLVSFIFIAFILVCVDFVIIEGIIKKKFKN